MRVVCDNCGAVYQIPNEKLTKPGNKATCKKCNYRMLIPSPNAAPDPEAQTVITAAPKTTPKPKEQPKAPEKAAKAVKEAVPVAVKAAANATTPDASKEYFWIMVFAASAMVGSILLAANISPFSRHAGLFVALAGGASTLFVILSSNMGRTKGKPPHSARKSGQPLVY